MPFTILPNSYLLPLPINKCLGHSDLLNISHVHHVYLQLRLSFKSFEKIILQLFKRDPCPGPCALGGSCYDLPPPPFSTRQVVCGTKFTHLPIGCTCPYRAYSQCPGLQSSLFKRPKPAARAWWASYHVHPPNVSSHHQSNHSKA